MGSPRGRHVLAVPEQRADFGTEEGCLPEAELRAGEGRVFLLDHVPECTSALVSLSTRALVTRVKKKGRHGRPGSALAGDQIPDPVKDVPVELPLSNAKPQPYSAHV